MDISKLPNLELPKDPRIRALLLAKATVLARRTNRLEQFRPHPKQREIIKLTKDYPAVGGFGGNQTGKSKIGAHILSVSLTGRYPDDWEGRRWNRPVHAWAAGESWSSNVGGCQKMLLGEVGDWGTGEIPLECIDLSRMTMQGGVSGAVSTVKIKHVSGGWSTLSFRAYEQRRKKFQSETIDLAWLDEEPPWDIFSEVGIRVFRKKGYVLLAFTPLEGMSDVASYFIHQDVEVVTEEDEETGEKPQVFKLDRAYVSMSWQDNPYLDPAQIAMMERRYASRPHELEARRNGVPSIGPGACFPVADEAIRYQDFEIPFHWPCGLGGDFAFKAPTAFTWNAWDPANDVTYLFREYKVAQAPIKDHADAIKSYERTYGELPKFGDASADAESQLDGEKVLDRYRENGVHFMPADRKLVESGIAEILERMLTGRFKVAASCGNWFREKAIYGRDDKGKIIKRQEFNGEHEIDGTRYAHQHRTLWRPRRRLSVAPRRGPVLNQDPLYGGS